MFKKECSITTAFCINFVQTIHVCYPRGLLVPVNVDCDIESLHFYNWLCFVTIELLLNFKMYGMHCIAPKPHALSRNVNRKEKVIGVSAP